MKTTLTIFCLAAIVCLAHCKKDTSTLPPETQSGAGTFGCKIDGKVWVPRGTNYNSGENVTATYSHAYPGTTGYTLIIGAHDYEGNPRSIFNIGMDSMKLSTGMTIELTNSKGMGGATYSVNDENFNYITYYVNDSLRGKMQIIKIDEVGQVVSGSFWFDAINRFGEKVHVTDGRFDVKYTR